MHTDIIKTPLIERIPERFKPYALLARLDRPIGWWLLLLPGWWAIALAAGGIIHMSLWHWFIAVLFLIGAIIMRAAGCVINDLWDRNLDKEVERTRERPLAAGTISPFQAVVFLGVLLFCGFAILILMPGTTILLGLLCLPLIIAYPFMKRITYWPQAFLGLTFNFSALMGWSAATDSLSFTAFLLYMSAMLWTLGYDTIYAHQDKEDDVLVGIKSLALKFGENSKKWVAGFYAGAILFLVLAVLMAGSPQITIILLIAPLIYLIWQLSSWDMDDPESSLAVFKSNKIYGLLVLGALLI